MNILNGQVALVTGASRGLGEATARAMAAVGATVVLTARSADKIAAIASEIIRAGGKALAIPCDTADYAQVEHAAKEATAKFGRVDILINNAGVIEPIATVATSDPALWAQNININLVGAYNSLRTILPGMLAQGSGCIINISSGAAYRILEGWSAYCAGKAGLVMLTNAVHLENAAKGIRIFGFSPGTIDTEMQATIRASGLNAISKIPRSELLPVADAVRGVLYLCGGTGDDLTGKDVSMRDEVFRTRIGLG